MNVDLVEFGFTPEEAKKVQATADKLHLFYELICGLRTPDGRGAVWIEQDEDTDLCTRYTQHPDHGTTGRPVRDMEAVAMKALRKLEYQGRFAFHLQGDPRGCPITIRRSDGQTIQVAQSRRET